MTFPPSIPFPALASAREIAILRLVGRLGVAETPWIGRLLFRDVSLRSMQAMLTSLVDQHLLWRMEGRRQLVATKTPGKTIPRKGPYLYGLTADARALLGELGAEPRDGTLQRLIARDRRAPLPTLSSLDDDLARSAWCASVLDHARRTPMLAGVNLQAGCQIWNNADELVQTIGAVLILAFNPKGQQVTRPAWELPWLSGEALDPSWRLVRFALEADTGVANSATIMMQAQTYSRLSQNKTYQKLFGGPIKPVVLTPPGDRINTVAQRWQEAWPATPAMFTSVDSALHPDYGALWGSYAKLVQGGPCRAIPLEGLVSTVEKWAKLVAKWPYAGGWAGA
ncbi:MAG: hypothetical protein HGA45_12555 [Chloroflexales bacterium]|nr:hypothetical protein [Chloroflexales bacterium]